jgi:hypothetical protein
MRQYRYPEYAMSGHPILMLEDAHHLLIGELFFLKAASMKQSEKRSKGLCS